MMGTRVSSICVHRPRQNRHLPSEAHKLQKLKVEEYGHSTGWINEKGEEIDFGSDNARAKAEAQAKLHKLIAGLHA